MRKKKPKLPSSVDAPVQPDPKEQSGSAGRYTSADVLDTQKDTGQGRYGQSGYAGGNPDPGTEGQRDYQKSDGAGADKFDSNKGSGRTDHEADEH